MTVQDASEDLKRAARTPTMDTSSSQAGPSTISSPAMQPSQPSTLLFARGILALLDLWPALHIAITQGWGHPDSVSIKPWLASVLVDQFETSLSSPAPLASAAPSSPDFDELADWLHETMSDEFEATIEDGSIEAVTGDIIRLWRDVAVRRVDAPSPEELVSALERRAAQIRGSMMLARGVDVEEVEGSESGGEDGESDGMEVDGEEAPRLVERKERDGEEVQVDEEGFTLVQKGARRNGR